jgi:uncharacterized protein YegL
MENNADTNNNDWDIVNNSETNLTVEVPIEEKPIDDMHLIMVLDESGSMESIRSDISGSIRCLLREQKELKKDNSTFTLVKFNGIVTTVYDKKPLQEVPEFTDNNYIPSGGTALYDAIGQSIEKYNADKNVLMFIVTDGEENSSSNYNHTKILTLINKKKEEAWSFIYLSADLTTAKQGTNIGFSSSERNVSTTEHYQITFTNNAM